MPTEGWDVPRGYYGPDQSTLEDESFMEMVEDRMNLDQLTLMIDGRPSDWVAACGLCGEHFAIRDEDAPEGNPSPSGTFCPDCMARKHIAPGVLNWQRRSDTK